MQCGLIEDGHIVCHFSQSVSLPTAHTSIMLSDYFFNLLGHPTRGTHTASPHCSYPTQPECALEMSKEVSASSLVHPVSCPIVCTFDLRLLSRICQCNDCGMDYHGLSQVVIVVCHTLPSECHSACLSFHLTPALLLHCFSLIIYAKCGVSERKQQTAQSNAIVVA